MTTPSASHRRCERILPQRAGLGAPHGVGNICAEIRRWRTQLVRRTDGRNADDRSLLADVLEAAVRDGGGDGDVKPKGARAVVLVGFGAGGGAQCDDFLSDERLKSCARHFAARGGVVLIQGRGGAIDLISRHWFQKTWTSGLKRGAERSWRYNSDSAWGGGYFARFSDAASAQGEPSLRKEVRFGVVYEVERVKPVDAVYLSVPHKDEEDEEDEKPVIGYRNVTLGATCAVAFGAFGGGHVGCIGAGDDHQETTLRVIQGLCDAAPGVGTPDALKRLKKSGMKGFDLREVATGGGGQVAVEPSMTKFALFAVFSCRRVHHLGRVPRDACHQIQHVDYMYVLSIRLIEKKLRFA